MSTTLAILTAASAVIWIAIEIAFWLRHKFFILNLNNSHLQQQNALLQEVATEYKESWITSSKNVERMSKNNFDLAMEILEQPNPEEWDILYTLCQLLEANGTVFEPGSVISNWWLNNKGTAQHESKRG